MAGKKFTVRLRPGVYEEMPYDRCPRCGEWLFRRVTTVTGLLWWKREQSYIECRNCRLRREDE